MIKRNYRIKFIVCIEDNESKNFGRYYFPKWSKFMKIITSKRFNELDTIHISELSLIRKVISKDLKTEDISILLSKYNPELSRMLLEVSPLFDKAPVDLKAHIIGIFGIKPKELFDFLNQSNKENEN